MRTWLRHHVLSLAQTLARLTRTPLATAFNVLVIGVALALPLAGYCLLANVQSLARGISAEPQISVFLQTGAGKGEIDAIGARLRAASGVQGVQFLSREAALAELKQERGMAEVISTLSENPLPDAFVVTLARNDPALAERLEGEFRALAKVAHVQVDSAWIARLAAFLRLGRTAVVLLGLLLCAALVAVTFNTIRLQILTHADEIEVSRLVGATDAYVRRPFFYLGSVLGALGGVAALALVFIALAALNRDIAQLTALYGLEFALRFPDLRESASVIAVAGVLGWAGAGLSVSKHLREVALK